MRYVTFFLRTKRIPYLLNRAAKAGVRVFDVRLTSEGGSLRVARKASVLFREILREEGIPFEERGKSLLGYFLYRPVLPIAFFVVLILMLFFGSFVYGVEITGNQYVNSAEIRGVLAQNHVDGFIYKGKIDLEKIRSDIVALDGVSFASVGIKGNTLYVNVKEEILPLSPEEERYEAVTAMLGGVITKVVAESGTPRVSVGDTVSAGDVLIAPAYAFTEGEAPAPAKGEVYASTVYKKELILPLFSLEKERTGNKVCVREVYFFGKKLTKDVFDPFPDYELSERVLYEGGGVCILEKTYEERREVTVCHDFELEAPRLIEEARAALLAEVPFYAYGSASVVAEQKKMDNMLYIVLYYTVVQRIDSLFLPSSDSAGR